jgi:nitroimidazol reductase NimA-like FMN-containing flavoprotein (pyridoxamine 5'-phosphate oxidase superfamily)
MNANPAAPQEPHEPPSQQAGIAARVEVRCRQLGLTPDLAARRAGMSVHYLRYLLTAEGDFDRAALLRLAAVLQTTYEELQGGRGDAAPGQRPPAARPVLMRLNARECWDRVGTHGIGRVGIPARPGPLVLPVNYCVDGTSVAYRTDPDGAAAAPDGTEVSFEVDHFDEHHGTGWSVLITGAARHVTDPEAARRLAEHPGATPWAGGKRDLWIRVSPAEITGRVIRSTA